MKLKLLTDFRKDEQGGILAFYLIMFITMMIGGGMAIDFIRHEIKREALQDAMDRGVLAAAGSAQTLAPTSASEIAAAEAIAVATVRSYISVSGFDPDVHGVVVTPNITAFSQRVDADANFSLDTYFLRLTGIDQLGGIASAGAAVSVNSIELSLIVDISGSMGGTKIANLRTAAKEFSTLMLQGDRSLNTSISLVPFSGQVSATPAMLSTYNYTRWHTYSSCVDFDAPDFNATSISSATPLTQTQHFAPQWLYDNNSDWCPRADSAITPLSNSLVDLKASIDLLHATGNTAAQIGMKWGVALLDDSSQSMVTNLISQGTVDGAFAGRPAAANDDNTLKFAILMTDGDNTNQYAIKNDVGEYYRYQTYEVIIDPANDPGVPPNYNAPLDIVIDNGDWNETRIEATGQRSADYWNLVRTPWSFSHLFTRVAANEEDSRLQAICTAAKDAGIVVFTIGYDVSPSSNAHNQMRACASTPGHFYNVETTDLSVAFNSIYQTIQKLKLVN